MLLCTFCVYNINFITLNAAVKLHFYISPLVTFYILDKIFELTLKIYLFNFIGLNLLSNTLRNKYMVFSETS